MGGATARQWEVLTFIQNQRVNGIAPTVREIGEALGIRSPHGVVGHLRALAKKGLISWLPGKSRTIMVTMKVSPVEKIVDVLLTIPEGERDSVLREVRKSLKVRK